MARTTPSRGTISPAVGAARIIHANGGCTLAARGRDMCRPRSRGRKGRTTYINAGNRPILHVRAGKDTGCGSPDSLKDFRYTAGSSPCKGCCLLCESRSEVISIRFPRENIFLGDIIRSRDRWFPGRSPDGYFPYAFRTGITESNRPPRRLPNPSPRFHPPRVPPAGR